MVKTGGDGQIVRLRDVGRVELAARSQDVSNFLDDMSSAGIRVFRLPGSNTLATAARIKAKMQELSEQFPDDVDYRIVYDTTPTSPNRSTRCSRPSATR